MLVLSFAATTAAPAARGPALVRGGECGDSVVQPGEECDDGNRTSGDGCSSSCLEEFCGDGIVNGGEECDDGVDNSDTRPDACRTDCRNPSCGDGVPDSGHGELCDDGNRIDADGCESDCTYTEWFNYCPNGVVDPWEQCDDGNDSNDDECTNWCRFNLCGDGFLGPYEGCDDANTDDYDGCTNYCQLREGCGDADANGRITARDAVLALHDALYETPWCRFGVCDVDGNGDVTTADALLVLRGAVKLPVVLTCLRTS